MDELTIVLVEDDPHACENFANCANKMDDINIVNITNNTETALQNIQDFLPHVIILDLELHNGTGNGMTLLSRLKELNLPIYPYILITTNNSSTTTYDSARDLGADFIMSKHQTDYSEENVLSFLQIIKKSIRNKVSSHYPGLSTVEPPELQEKRMTCRIMEELNLIGISPKAIGYGYLIDAILIMAKAPTQNITTILGKKYGKTESSVERAMFNAINKAWKQSDIEVLAKYYTAKIQSARGTPTITEFICYYANKLKNEY